VLTSHRGCFVRVLFGHCLFGRLTVGKGRYFCDGSLSIGIVGKKSGLLFSRLGRPIICGERRRQNEAEENPKFWAP
jgi:hypothetical protein